MEIEKLEVLIREIKNWGENVAENAPSKYPDKIQMKAFLSECGADLEKVELHKDSMKSWTVAGMEKAMKAIWGKEWEYIQEWNEVFVGDFEDTTGLTLPHINIYRKGTNKKEIARVTKQSPMKHILGLMTRWAALDDKEDPEFTQERFEEEIKVRVSNGYLRLQGINSKDKLFSLKRPDTNEIYHPSLPPDYIVALIDYLLRD